ncbi:unnamed protein product [Closterium sp. NIES-65]|nr:unnamed protein product [Closterium sp. NIES-65]
MEPKWKTRQEQRTNGSMDEPPIPAWGWPAGGDVHPTAWQHSLEYFLVADLLQPPSKRDAGVAAVRVSDPAHADVFLVPFFASTMVNLLRRKNFPTYKALAMEMAELMSASPWWQRRGGRDHVLCVTHPNALESVRHHMAAAAFVAVDLARYEPGEADLHKDIIAPYGALVETYTAEAERRDAQGGLAGGGRGGAAQGPIRRLQGGSDAHVRKAAYPQFPLIVLCLLFDTPLPSFPPPQRRKALFDELQGEADVHVREASGSSQSIRDCTFGNMQCTFGNMQCTFGNMQCTFGNMQCTFGNMQCTFGNMQCTFGNMQCTFGQLSGQAAGVLLPARGGRHTLLSQEGMRQSRFCLHVEGDTPSSSRFFNAIMSGCVPVVVSDNVELPFESAIDYSRLTLFFSQQDALVKGRLVSALRQVSEQEWLAMWHEVHQVQKHFEFQQPARAGDAVDMVWREVRNRLPSMHLMAHRDTRLTIPDWSA